jgi:hypothetical protein
VELHLYSRVDVVLMYIACTLSPPALRRELRDMGPVELFVGLGLCPVSLMLHTSAAYSRKTAELGRTCEGCATDGSRSARVTFAGGGLLVLFWLTVTLVRSATNKLHIIHPTVTKSFEQRSGDDGGCPTSPWNLLQSLVSFA